MKVLNPSAKDTSARARGPSREIPVKEEAILDVLILGAGWAGLGAGRRLFDDDEHQQPRKNPSLRFRILEARDYIGGRSRTVSTTDLSSSSSAAAAQVELGSQWIHGANKRNPMYQIALGQQDVTMQSSTNDSAAAWVDYEKATSDGGSNPNVSVKRLEDNETANIERDLLRGRKGFYAFLDKYYNTRLFRGCTKAKSKNSISVREVLDEYARKRKLSPQDHQYLIWLVDADLSGDNATSLEDLSAKHYDDGKEFSGGDVHFVSNENNMAAGNQGTVAGGGYSKLVKSFSEPISNFIQCGCVVTSIDYSSDRDLVVVDYVQGGKTHRILTKRVICTVPLGVLKAGSISFTPPLPKPKKQAIQNLGMGLYNKVILVWDAKDQNHLPWLDNKNMGVEGGELTTERVWMERIPLPGQVQSPWSQCYNPRSHHRPDHPILLYFFLSGRIAESVEHLSNEEIQSQALQALREWFPSKHPIPEPQQVVVTRWGQDPFARGSYSFYSLASSPKDRKILAAPLQDKLYFAGEATNVHYFATTHGALMSGRDAADLILEGNKK